MPIKFKIIEKKYHCNVDFFIHSSFQSFIIIFFLLVTHSLFSQNKNVETQRAEIYRLIRESDRLNGSNDLKSLQFAKDATKLAEEIGTSRDKANCYMIIANILTSLGLYDKSFVYLEKSLNEPFAKDDITHQIIIKEIKANNYWKLSLKNQAIAEHKNVIQIVNNQPEDYGLTYYKAIALRDLGLWNSKINRQDSALIYLKKAELILKKFPKLETSIHFHDIPNIYLIKGDVLLAKKQQDSAFYYFEKGYNIIRNNKEEAPTLHSFYFSFGDYFKLKKEYKKAINFYQKSIDEMAEHNINDVETKINVYKNIADLYGLLNQPKEKETFLIKYYDEKDKLSAKTTYNVQKAVDYILSENKKEISVKENLSKTKLISIIIIVLLISLLGFLYFYQKINRKRKKTAYKLKITEKTLLEKEQQTQALKIKVNESFDEIINLAKENHPNFYTRFQEVYPDFQRKILEINSTLQNSELILLAYIYLNFETKEIADYLFKSPKTIQNRKHNLRKKLQIPSSIDFYVWLRTIEES